jgi:hypothetical protein
MSSGARSRSGGSWARRQWLAKLAGEPVARSRCPEGLALAERLGLLRRPCRFRHSCTRWLRWRHCTGRSGGTGPACCQRSAHQNSECARGQATSHCVQIHLETSNVGSEGSPRLSLVGVRNRASFCLSAMDGPSAGPEGTAICLTLISAAVTRTPAPPLPRGPTCPVQPAREV